jgi:hypothetical protein
MSRCSLGFIDFIITLQYSYSTVVTVVEDSCLRTD